MKKYKTNINEIGHPRFIDPLYRQYETDYSKQWTKFPNMIDPQYPIVDPYRRRLFWGNTHRTQFEGYCPPGYFCAGRHNYCKQMEPEGWGTFYNTNCQSKCLLEYANGKMPYNKSVCCGPEIAAANGLDNNNTTTVARCINQNFW